jgi:D-glycero-alpha-D-manno-heptose-7-phosphate kinase
MIVSTAPTRIDLAGGTLDLWPLYLFFDNPPTINAAIDLYASVEIRPRRDNAVVIESRDLKIKAKFRSVTATPVNHPLQLILRLIRFYEPATGLEVVTHCQAPAGSGIGGSSSLNIALNGALNRFTKRGYSKAQMIEIAKNIETQVINVPAGIQDYYAAMYGGVQAIQPGIERVENRHFPVSPAELTQRFVLCFTGKPHHSGINNWAVYKRTINGDSLVCRKLKRIANASWKMERVLDEGGLKYFAPLFTEEWKARKALAPSISTPKMERLIRAAKKAGALAGKVCGAGGGGCVAFFIQPGSKNAVSSALQERFGESRVYLLPGSSPEV